MILVQSKNTPNLSPNRRFLPFLEIESNLSKIDGKKWRITKTTRFTRHLLKISEWWVWVIFLRRPGNMNHLTHYWAERMEKRPRNLVRLLQVNFARQISRSSKNTPCLLVTSLCLFYSRFLIVIQECDLPVIVSNFRWFYISYHYKCVVDPGNILYQSYRPWLGSSAMRYPDMNTGRYLPVFWNVSINGCL